MFLFIINAIEAAFLTGISAASAYSFFCLGGALKALIYSSAFLWLIKEIRETSQISILRPAATGQPRRRH